MSEALAAVEQTPAPIEVSVDDEMGAMFDRLTADDVIEAENDEAVAGDVVEAEEVQAEGEAEVAPEITAPPPDLPASIKAKWADMPPEAQEAVLSSHRDLSRKLAGQGRIVQASRPVYDVLVRAANELPSLQNMTPDQIATDVFAMAKIQNDMANDPVRTLLGIATQYGAMDGIRQAIGGQAPNEASQNSIALAQEIKSLRAQLEQAADPNMIDQRISQSFASREVENTVSTYAATKEHWAAVEPVLPMMIPIAKARLGEGASAQDVLNAAYDMAIHADPDLRAKVTVAAPAPAQPDPARTAAQRLAKSVNVTSRPGTARTLTEDQALGAIWDKHRN